MMLQLLCTSPIILGEMWEFSTLRKMMLKGRHATYGWKFNIRQGWLNVFDNNRAWQINGVNWINEIDDGLIYLCKLGLG